MPYRTPAELFDSVVNARNLSDLATYVACYEPDATMMPEQGTVTHGHESIAAFLTFSLH
jgi:ketosteroid isomerase-like protein